MGKTTAMKQLALLWATNKKGCGEGWSDGQHIGQFDFLFYIPLKKIKSDIPLEQIIINEHCELKKRAESGQLGINDISSILKDDKVIKMIIFDGLDEFKMGIYKSVDAAIKHNTGNAFLTLTTRPGKKMKSIQKYMNAEAIIQGFSDISVMKFVHKFFKDPKVANRMLFTSSKSGISEFLHIPILLVMSCWIYKVESKLPKKRVQILEKIVHWSIKRNFERCCISKADTKITNLLLKLGQVAWEELQNDNLLMDKVGQIHNNCGMPDPPCLSNMMLICPQ